MPQMNPKLTRKKPSFWEDSFHRKGVAMLASQGGGGGAGRGRWGLVGGVDWGGGKVRRSGEENHGGKRGMVVSVGVSAVVYQGWAAAGRPHRHDSSLWPIGIAQEEHQGPNLTCRILQRDRETQRDGGRRWREEGCVVSWFVCWAQIKRACLLPTACPPCMWLQIQKLTITVSQHHQLQVRGLYLLLPLCFMLWLMINQQIKEWFLISVFFLYVR